MTTQDLLKKYFEIEEEVYIYLMQKFRSNRYSEEIVKSNPSGMTQAMISLLLLDEIKKLNENFGENQNTENKKSNTRVK